MIFEKSGHTVIAAWAYQNVHAPEIWLTRPRGACRHFLVPDTVLSVPHTSTTDVRSTCLVLPRYGNAAGVEFAVEGVVAGIETDAFDGAELFSV